MSTSGKKAAQLAPSRFTVFVIAPAAKRETTGVKRCRFKWRIYYAAAVLTAAHPRVPRCLNKPLSVWCGSLPA